MGKRAFIIFCFFNAFTFVTQPLMVLQDSFPDVVAGSKEAALGAFCFEVVSLYLVMAGLIALIPMKAYGLALSSNLGLALITKHVILNKSGPPPPMIGLWIAATIMAWKEYGWTMKPACDKAIKSGRKRSTVPSSERTSLRTSSSSPLASRSLSSASRRSTRATRTMVQRLCSRA